jgi:response regulator of citrate/malate metabolism
VIRVLVVDDDFMVAKVHSSFVERTPGFTVAGAVHSGRDALAAAAELQPDLLLLDVYLPDMTGLQVLQQLRVSPGPESAVDVLVVTAAKDAETVRTALHGGASGYLIKPFEYDDLRSRLEGIADVRRRLQHLAGSSEPALQNDVDRLFSGAPIVQQPSALPKRVAADTNALVRKALQDAGPDGLSARECAERTGLSRVSARRYLEYLTQVGVAEVQSRYGGAGRPERIFRVPQ